MNGRYSPNLAFHLLRILFVSLLISAWCAEAQTSKPTDGSTPLALQAGRPAGSFSLSGFDNINPYNGSLNFSLPLLNIGGRGGASHTIMLPIERHFMIERYVDPWGGIWLSPIDGREEEIKPGYGPGVMALRYGGRQPTACPTPTPEGGGEDPGPQYFNGTVTRLSFTAPDGTEMEFRDVQTGGQTHSNYNYNCDTNPQL